jgi:hypothetical protein
MKFLAFTIVFSVLLVFTFNTKAQEISPYLVGTNLWYTNPSAEVWNLTKASGVQMIRIGGAEYDRNMPSNATILSWVKNIRANGAEPIIQVSQYKSAAVAASLVKYLNVDKSGEIAPVKYWNIGNEPWLQANRPATSSMAAFVATYFKPIAAAMKEIDPTIKIYGPDECYYMEDAYNALFGSKGANDIAGKIPGKDYYYCDGISWHRYPNIDASALSYAGIDDFKGSIVKCKARVDFANNAHNRTGDDKLSWGIGEYNAEGGSKVHSWENGQMFGGILGLCMKYEAMYATSWSMFENGGSRSGTDFSMIDGTMKPRASYWHMQFVAEYFKGSYIDGTSSSTDFIVYGAQNEEQTAVMIMNRASGALKEYTLQLNDTATSDATYKLKIKAGKDVTYSDIITPRTTQVLIFRGDSIIKINYTSTDFDKLVPPTVSTVTVATELPATPAEHIASPMSHNSVTLTWSDLSDNESAFIVEREISGVFKTIAVTPANTTSYTETGLSPETTYRYRIQAYNSLGKSAYSEIETVTTQAIPEPKAFNGPHVIPGKIEAENFDINGQGLSYHDLSEINEGGKYRTTAVDIEASTDDGGGSNVAYIESGEWLTYLIESVTPGTYDIALRTASASTSTATKRIDVYINDVKVGSVTPSNTGGWQNWETKYIKNVVIDDATPKLMKLKFTGADYNLNWIAFGNFVGSSNLKTGLNSMLKSYYNTNSKQVTVVLDEMVEKATVQVSNSLGQSFYRNEFSTFSNTEIGASAWPKGIYLVSVQNKDQRYVTKLMID